MAVELPTVPHVDLPRYLGVWFEIARKPMRYEDAAARDITARYALNDDGSVQVCNACIDEDGKVQVSQGRAEAVDATNAKLTVTFLPEGLRWIPFTKGDYWILRLDENYTTALVGDPARKYLWLLHRAPLLDADTVTEWLASAQSLGYDTGDVIRPKQSGAVHDGGT